MQRKEIEDIQTEEQNEAAAGSEAETKAKTGRILEKESFAVQRADWILTQIENRRKTEDEVRIKMEEEQKLLEERLRSIEDGMNRNIEMRRYNEQRREQLDEEVYGFYGVSTDKREGIKEYRKALFKGCAVILFVLSFALTLLTAYLYGPVEKITVAMAGCVAAQGALMPGKNRRNSVMQWICNLLYITVFPAMIYLFVGYEFRFAEYDLILLGVLAAVLIYSFIGSISYFIYDPYRRDKGNVKEAQKELKQLHKAAKKQIRRNQKIRRKEEKRQAQAAEKEARKEEKMQLRRLKKEDLAKAKEEKKTAAQEARKEAREKREKFLREKKEKLKLRKKEKVRKAEETDSGLQGTETAGAEEITADRTTAQKENSGCVSPAAADERQTAPAADAVQAEAAENNLQAETAENSAEEKSRETQMPEEPDGNLLRFSQKKAESGVKNR